MVSRLSHNGKTVREEARHETRTVDLQCILINVMKLSMTHYKICAHDERTCMIFLTIDMGLMKYVMSSGVNHVRDESEVGGNERRVAVYLVYDFIYSIFILLMCTYISTQYLCV